MLWREERGDRVAGGTQGVGHEAAYRDPIAGDLGTLKIIS